MAYAVRIDVALINQAPALGVECETANTVALGDDCARASAGRNIEISSNDVRTLG